MNAGSSYEHVAANSSTVGRSGPGEQLLLLDDFSQGGTGRVVGTVVDGYIRRGIDAERVLSIDDQSLRISPMRRPGWARCSLAYGPFAPDAGLGMSIHVLNGHHASEDYALRRLRSQLRSWLHGSHTRSLARRVPELMLNRRRRSAGKRLADWVYHWRHDAVALEENMTAGFFAVPAPATTDDLSAAFAIRGAGADNGELAMRVGSSLYAGVRRLTNVPMHLIAMLREDAVTYYVSSLAHAVAGAPHPLMQPLAIDGAPLKSDVYVGVEQQVLGEIGFSVDSRVYGVRVAMVPTLGRWPGTAHVADRMSATGPLDEAAVGGRWIVVPGALEEREPSGGVSSGDNATALIYPDAPTGLIRVRLEPTNGATGAAIFWRALDNEDHLRLEMTSLDARLVCRAQGADRVLSAVALASVVEDLQILDDGTTIRAAAGGSLLFEVPVPEDAHDERTGVGFGRRGTGPLRIREFEAHPREIPIPISLRSPAATWIEGNDVVIDDQFVDTPCHDLEGRTTSTGSWRRRMGRGRFEVEADGGLRVAAVPDRTAYTVPWPFPECADVNIRIVPVRSGHRSRAGAIFMQDDANFLIVSLWFNDRDDGAASVSSFVRLDGREDVYDAVWVNVRDRLQWDEPVDLRIAFDGGLYHASLNNEPVLWRSVRDIYPGARPLAVHETGIVANWEWGLDTGSRILSFRALSGAS